MVSEGVPERATGFVPNELLDEMKCHAFISDLNSEDTVLTLSLGVVARLFR